MSTPSITQLTDPDAETVAAIADGLNAFNREASGVDFAPEPCWLVARGPSGLVIGGLKGRIAWHWLGVEWLWVHAEWRGRGLGSDLLRRAEEAALARGCCGVFLDTFSFQAPRFYERHGYSPFGRLDGLPKGHARIWFAKRL